MMLQWTNLDALGAFSRFCSKWRTEYEQVVQMYFPNSIYNLVPSKTTALVKKTKWEP